MRVFSAKKPNDSPYRQRWRQYHQRFGAETAVKLDPPVSGLGLIVVIPCYNEPELIQTLNALHSCTRPDCAVEVLLIINASLADDDAVHKQNKSTLVAMNAWAGQYNDTGFRLHCVYAANLPSKHRGVGLARKIGLDLAVSRFAEVGQEEGVCLSLDADCLVAQNYLLETAKHFQRNQQCQLAVINFVHRIDEIDDIEQRKAIIAYELHLRYYVQGIRYAGLPYGYHTLGSCFAVRAGAYMAQGGMNKRQAGEDFYFIHKFSALGQCERIQNTCVMPSARLSQRVPFGTGPAVARWMAKAEDLDSYRSYNPKVFCDLLGLSKWLRRISQPSDFDISGLAALPEALQVFLQQQGIEQRVLEIRNNSASVETMIERFLQWFNAFLALKYIHFSHREVYQEVPLLESARQLIPCPEAASASDLAALLHCYRQYEAKKRDINDGFKGQNTVTCG